MTSDDDAAEMFFNAVQSLTLNNYGSNNSLSSLDASEIKAHKSRVEELVKLFVPEFVKGFVSTYDEFLHNHDRCQQPTKDREGEEEEEETVFPKLC